MVDRFGWLVLILTSVVLIVGGYQFYFLPQRKKLFNPRLFTVTRFDNWIPFKPGWVWIYSGLYYPAIVALIFVVGRFEAFCYTVFGFITLLMAQITCFWLFPVRTPEAWRQYDTQKNCSTKMLACVQSKDKADNCFPSMHTSVAMLTALQFLYHKDFGAYAPLLFLFPVLIGISTLFTKQHYWIDVPAGALLGWGIYELFLLYVPY